VNYNLAKARNHYQSLDLASRVEGLSPHGLVALLYVELLHSLDVMAAALRHGRALSSEVHAVRAQSILLALSGSLDFERGGAVTLALNTVYRAMSRQLRAVISEGDTDKLAELRIGVDTIASSWNQLIKA
jgi:flagellar secretion chaperone FliS